MSEEKVLNDIFIFLLENKTTIDYINFDKPIPEFKLSIKDKLEDSDDLKMLLKEIYKVFWVLTYGKPNDSNKDNKIEIKYQLV